jgi:hypothetical protein
MDMILEELDEDDEGIKEEPTLDIIVEDESKHTEL